ncbi:8-amino-7-oxononanoate synthase [Chlamydiota bacterium]
MDFMKKELKQLKKDGLYREMRCVESSQGPEIVINHKKYLCFCSNNYLGLANNEEIKKEAIKAIKKYGVGTGASRLISGNMFLHELLEEKIALFKRKEAGIVFTTGYMANLGTISALAGNNDLVIVDKLNHASIIDACRLSGAHLRVYPHKNMIKLEKFLLNSDKYNKKIIITDSLFSMDGDIAPLKNIVALARKYDAITMIDEAHATGVFGGKGRGVAEYLDVENDIDICMGTFSKSLGSLGGYVVGKKTLIEYLRNKARSFVYTTGIPPAICATSIAALDYCKNHLEIKESLWSNVRYMQENIEKLGYTLLSKDSQIISIIIGDIKNTMNLSDYLFSEGIMVPGIRPPTVPKGTSRLRISVMANHSKEQLDRCLEAFEECAKMHRNARNE